MTKERFVYFMRPVGMSGPVKIGCSNGPLHRLRTLMAWSPFPLEIAAVAPGSFDLEKNIHECLADCHSHHEWFHADPRIDAAIAKLAAGRPLAEAIDLNDRRGNIRTEAQKNRRRNWTPEQRAHFSYDVKLASAGRRLLRAGSKAYFEPRDVRAIMTAWGNLYKGTATVVWLDGRLPTPAERARLDEVLNNPSAHYVTRDKAYPELFSDEEAA